MKLKTENILNPKTMNDKYILEGKRIKRADDLLEWAKWFEKVDRSIKQTKITNEINVSTVFLGLDHSFGGPAPILFETMIFGGPHDQYRERHTTYEEAEEGHLRAVKLCEQ